MTLHTFTRVITEEGDIEYHNHVSRMRYKDLPVAAVHMTNKAGNYAVVDMEPNLPAYSQAPETDAQGNPRKAHNFFTAQGYYTYAIDNRLKEAENAAVTNLKSLKDLDWTKYATICAAGAVALLVVWRFLA